MEILSTKSNIETGLSSARKTDLERMTRIASGDRREMRSVFEEFSSPLKSFVQNWLARPNDAADVVSEVMIEVWKNAERYQGRAALKTWVFSIARNKSIDQNRKGSRLDYTDKMPEMTDLSQNAVEALSASEEAKALKRAMMTLSEAHRRSIHLAFFEDMSYEEIAMIEDCPVGTIKTRILYAKKLLMREIINGKKVGVLDNNIKI